MSASAAQSEQKPNPNPVGRPPQYQDHYPELARNYCLLGATDKELADYFHVSTVTINAWKTKYPEFLNSMDEGREIADARVAESLYQRALGYKHPEVHICTIDGEVVQTPITKIYPPEVHAAKFWLTNRQRSKWRDKIETGITDTKGNDVLPDSLEIARRLAFLLTQGVEEK